MAKVKGTNRRTRPKSGYKKQGNKKGRGVKEKDTEDKFLIYPILLS